MKRKFFLIKLPKSKNKFLNLSKSFKEKENKIKSYNKNKLTLKRDMTIWKSNIKIWLKSINQNAIKAFQMKTIMRTVCFLDQAFQYSPHRHRMQFQNQAEIFQLLSNNKIFLWMKISLSKKILPVSLILFLKKIKSEKAQK